MQRAAKARPAAAAPVVKPEGEEWVKNLTRLAAIISDTYKIGCAKQNIIHWKTWNPPFPAPKESNRYHLPTCLAWVKEHVLPKSGVASEEQKLLFQLELKANSELAINKARRAELELAVVEGKYIERAVAERTAIGALKNYDGWTRQDIERLGPAQRKKKLELLGAPRELVAAFYEFDLEQSKRITDEVRKKFAEAAAALKEKLDGRK